MRWKLLEKIMSIGKEKDGSPNGPEIIKDNSPNLSLYEVKIKKIVKTTIKNKENETS
jgi:hypothetical protein